MTESVCPLCVLFFTTLADLFEISFDFLPVSEKAVIKVSNACIFGWIIILGCLSGLFKPLQSLVEIVQLLPAFHSFLSCLCEQLNQHAEL